jgi:hypothetical protein
MQLIHEARITTKALVALAHSGVRFLRCPLSLFYGSEPALTVLVKIRSSLLHCSKLASALLLGLVHI